MGLLFPMNKIHKTHPKEREPKGKKNCLAKLKNSPLKAQMPFWDPILEFTTKEEEDE